MIEVNLGRVVGSKIRNGTKEPSDFTKEDFVGWLDGDIYILNDPEQLIPYYEYKPETEDKLILLGNLKGTDGVDGEKGDTGPQGPQGMPGGIVWIGDVEELPSLSAPDYNNTHPLSSITVPGIYAFTIENSSRMFIMLVNNSGTLQKIYEFKDYYNDSGKYENRIKEFDIELYYRIKSGSDYWLPLQKVPSMIRPIYTHYIFVTGTEAEYTEGAKKNYQISITLTLPFSEKIDSLDSLIENMLSQSISALGYYRESFESGEVSGKNYETIRILKGGSIGTSEKYLILKYFDSNGFYEVNLASRNEIITIQDVVK